MKVERTAIPEVLLLEPKVFSDGRGFFFESYNRKTFRQATGLEVEFVQDNHSSSSRNVLRGLHYQVRQAQGKLVRVTAGEIWDVAVNLRRSSASFGRWVGMTLDAGSRRMLWVPAGFAHGFLVLSEFAEVQYKATDYYAPERGELPERRQRLLQFPSDLAVPAGQEDPQANTSAAASGVPCRSFSATTGTPASGHLMPSAGSLHRSVRSCSGA